MAEFVTPLVFGIEGWQNYDNTDDDIIHDVEDSSCRLSLSPTEEVVKLISHRKFDWTACESDDGLVLPISESSSSNQDSELSHSNERGFYDISMLTGGCYNCTTEDFVHPDVKLESILNEHHRQRLIANQIYCGSSTKQLCTSPEDIDNKKMRLNIAFSQGACVRPDDFWIKDSAGASDNIKMPAEAVTSSACVFDTALCTLKTGSVLSQNESDKRVDSDSEVDNPAKSTRQLSVYELEDIDVEPGIVHRTKLEIERRERSCSLIDIVNLPFSSSLTMSSPVQRSSSLRLPETKTLVGKTYQSKDRCSERRLSCIPFIVRDFSNAELKITSGNDHQQNCSTSPETITERHVVVNSCVLGTGDDNVEMVAGRVGKMKRDFEVKSKDETCERKYEELSFNIDNIPVEVGSVKRQTLEIEMKYTNTCKDQSVNAIHKQSDDGKSINTIKSMQTKYDCSITAPPMSTQNESSATFRRSYSYNEHRSSPDKPSLLNRVNSLRQRRQEKGSSFVSATSASRGSVSPAVMSSISCVRPIDSSPRDCAESSVSGNRQTDIESEVSKSTVTKSFSFTLPLDASITSFVNSCDAVPFDACFDDSAVQSHVKQRCHLFEMFGQSTARQQRPVMHRRSRSVNETYSLSKTFLSPVLCANSVSQTNTIKVASLNSDSRSVSRSSCDIAADVSFNKVSSLSDATNSDKVVKLYPAEQDVLMRTSDAVRSVESAEVFCDTLKDGNILMDSGMMNRAATAAAAAATGQTDLEGITVMRSLQAVASNNTADNDMAAHAAAVPVNQRYPASLTTSSSDRLLGAVGTSVIIPSTAEESLTSGTPVVITQVVSSDASEITNPVEPINLTKSVVLSDGETMVTVPTTGKMTVAETVPLTRHLDLAMYERPVTTDVLSKATETITSSSDSVSASAEVSPVATRRKFRGDSHPFTKLSVLYSMSDSGMKSASDQLEI